VVWTNLGRNSENSGKDLKKKENNYGETNTYKKQIDHTNKHNKSISKNTPHSYLAASSVAVPR
jgi:hypothetical protein